MTFSELERRLKKLGWQRKEGARHAYMVHPKMPGKKLMLGRHNSKEIPSGTLHSILKDAGLE